MTWKPRGAVAKQTLLRYSPQVKILDVYNFSICRGVELMKDRIHYDLCLMSHAPTERPSLGELNAQVIQSLLNGICNPVLFSGTQEE
jgi:hypothetical protein